MAAGRGVVEARTVDEEMYKEEILELYKHPLNKHVLPEYTLAYEKTNPLCGDRIVIYLQLKDDIIQDVSFDGNGCAISQAAASLLTERMKKMTMSDLITMSSEEMLALLGIPISHLRQKCALLCLQVVKEGIAREAKMGKV
ncbi:iron-sulfur cluster assembly scaffold protein [Candidatus Woesearchaeota archaeon]|nr:iron-sulfur cluster assembly scaffold protein [Candidatus Woesearchaeota archaeon]